MEVISTKKSNLLTLEEKNGVLTEMANCIEQIREELLATNQEEMEAYDANDKAMYDRLKVDDAKVDAMIKAVQEVSAKPDPIGKERYHFTNDNGMEVKNVTAPFGTVLIIYESRPDVTIEAAAIAFKSGNRILLKGGKESRASNLKLVACWHQALAKHGLPDTWIQYLDLQREQTQAFLKNPDQPLDLIVPRGGEKLIDFVKTHAKCPVLVSGRGNNFLYVHEQADLEMAQAIIANAKLTKISACNALDKVLVDANLPDYQNFVESTIELLRKDKTIDVLADEALSGSLDNVETLQDEQIWYEEFLDYKIVFGLVNNEEEAVEKINKYSGGHSATIVTNQTETADYFMTNVDAAAVYHNASTRFTDGGAFGMGAELAISTEKMHHRGPLGLEQLVSNKWYIYGNGQTR